MILLLGGLGGGEYLFCSFHIFPSGRGGRGGGRGGVSYLLLFISQLSISQLPFFIPPPPPHHIPPPPNPPPNLPIPIKSVGDTFWISAEKRMKRPGNLRGNGSPGLHNLPPPPPPPKKLFFGFNISLTW